MVPGTKNKLKGLTNEFAGNTVHIYYMYSTVYLAVFLKFIETLFAM